MDLFVKKIEAHAATMVGGNPHMTCGVPHILLSPTLEYRRLRRMLPPNMRQVHLLKHLWSIQPPVRLVHWLGGPCHLWARRFVVAITSRDA